MLLGGACVFLFLTGCIPHDVGCEQADLLYRIEFVRKYKPTLEIHRLDDEQPWGRVYSEVTAPEETEEILTLLEGEIPTETKGECCDSCKVQTAPSDDVSNAYKGIYNVNIYTFRGGGRDIGLFSPCTLITTENNGFATSRFYQISLDTTNEIFEIAYNVLLNQGYIEE